jgi:hypothetical protein
MARRNKTGMEELARAQKLRGYIIIMFTFFVILVPEWGKPETFQIDPEYLNGILTASSILCGFLAVILQREPKEYFEKFRYKYFFRDSIYYTLMLLSFSVICLSLNAAKVIPSELPLIFLTFSFLFNASILLVFLHYHFESIKLGKPLQPLQNQT